MMRRYGRRVRRGFLRCFRNDCGSEFVRTARVSMLILCPSSLAFALLAGYLQSMTWFYSLIGTSVISLAAFACLGECEAYLFDTSVIGDARNWARRSLRRYFPTIARRLDARRNPLPVMDVPMAVFPVAQEQGEAASERTDETSLDWSFENGSLIENETPISTFARNCLRAKPRLPPEAARHSLDMPSTETSSRELQEALAGLQTPPISMKEMAQQSRHIGEGDVARAVQPQQFLDVRRLPDLSPYPHQETGHVTSPRFQFGYPTSGERSDLQISAQEPQPRLQILPSDQETEHCPFLMLPPRQETPEEDSLPWVMRHLEGSQVAKEQTLMDQERSRVPTLQASLRDERPAQDQTLQVSPQQERLAQDPVVQARQQNPSQGENAQDSKLTKRPTLQIVSQIPTYRPFVMVSSRLPNQGLSISPRHEGPGRVPRLSISPRHEGPGRVPRSSISPRHEGPAQGPRLSISPRREGPARGPRLSISPRHEGPPRGPRLPISPSHEGPAQDPTRLVSAQQRPLLQIVPQPQLQEPVQDPGLQVSPRQERPEQNSENRPEQDKF